MRFGPLLASLVALSALAAPARAQTPDLVRIRGTIDAVHDGTLDLTTRSGEKRSVVIGAAPAVLGLRAGTLTDVKPGDYVGSAAMPQPDGTLRALEVQVFPEAMRGVGAGSRPWDVAPGSTMTNGTVGGTVAGREAHALTLTYPDGEKTIQVPAAAPVVIYGPGSPDLLVPGAHVFLTANRAEDGTLSTSRITVGRDGLVPPM